MKIGLVSDVHGNLPAFKAVLEDMAQRDVLVKACLGDTVGYGPYPNECMELVTNHFNYIILGNHDVASIDTHEALGFNPMAKQAIEWTNLELTEDNKRLIYGLEKAFLLDGGLLLIHGSPHNHFDYIINEGDAMFAFLTPLVEFNISFVGHTHVPAIWIKNGNGVKHIKPQFNKTSSDSFKFAIPENEKVIINVGSVGQPRDNDNRACYAIFDTETREVELIRVPYAIDRITGKMQRLGFSTNSWMRLLNGR